MKKKASAFGKYFPILFIVLIFISFNKIAGSERDLITALIIAMGIVFNATQLYKFYKEANRTINAIWVSAILLTIIGVILFYFFQQRIGLGISAIGIIAFAYTLSYSFLENRPDLQ